MTEEEKKTLVDAVNCKYPHQNLTEIYYNIGRALPFTAQRFPDGRVSDWYRNQYVEVVRVEPHGRGGKFGNVFGFYYRNGERADAVIQMKEQLDNKSFQNAINERVFQQVYCKVSQGL
jgi:hypothetical protein